MSAVGTTISIGSEPECLREFSYRPITITLYLTPAAPRTRVVFTHQQGVESALEFPVEYCVNDGIQRTRQVS